MNRPKPPSGLLQPIPSHQFMPAPELEEWLRASFLDDGSPLYNLEHAHLNEAVIGCLWTPVYNLKQMREIAGTAEIPHVTGSVWLKARVEWQLCEWFGQVPDFLITIYAPYASGCSDVEFCALVEHELYHCGQELDEWGMPKFKKDGSPKFGMRGHDVEEFVGVVRRYGVGATNPAVREFVEAANQDPEIAKVDIRSVCGTCLRMAA